MIRESPWDSLVTVQKLVSSCPAGSCHGKDAAHDAPQRGGRSAGCIRSADTIFAGTVGYGSVAYGRAIAPRKCFPTQVARAVGCFRRPEFESRMQLCGESHQSVPRQIGAAYNCSTTRPATRRKCPSPEGPTSTGNSKCRAVAAIARSFAGIALPWRRSSAKVRAH